jgi:arylsulfatase A-like enzyme
MGATAALLLSLAVLGAQVTNPNVILIVSDDQGSVDVNCYGAADLYTPNLDRLAGEGLRFTQFYVAAPVCSPSRGALITGRYPLKNGIVHNGQSLQPNEITIAEMLKPMGYRTAAIGKWHMGMKNGGPIGEGFDYFFGHRGGCIENYKHNILYWDEGTVRHHDLWRNDTEINEDDKHFGDLIARESISFIEKNKDKPFFLYIAFNSPHYPVQPLPHHFKRFEDFEEPRRSYAAFLSTLDEQLGRILSTLDELKIRNNTLVIFLSDHGHSIESRNALFVKGATKDNAGGGSAGPYRGNKFTVWEGGIRVPCIVSWPEKVPQSETRDQITTSMDILPTIAEFTGAQLPEKQLDGKSMTDVIASSASKTPHSFLHWGYKDMWAVREGRWKLVNHGKELLLSDMEVDVTETINLADKHPDIVTQLKQLHEAWIYEVKKQ